MYGEPGRNIVSVIDKTNNNVNQVSNIVSVIGTANNNANQVSSIVSVIDTANNTVIDTVNVERDPAAFGLSIDTVNVERDPAAFGLSMDTLPALEPVLPVATFSINLKENYDLLSMQPTDMSKNATSRNCGFSAMVNSAEQDPTNTYPPTENNTINLVATNANSTDPKPATIMVLEKPVLPVAGAAPYTYITNYSSDTVSVIDTATNIITATVKVGKCPSGIAVNPAGTKVYVANYGNNTVSVIDKTNNAVTATVKIGRYPSGVAVNPAGTKVYLTNYGSNTVSVIETTSNSVTATVKVGKNPSGVTVNPAGTKVYVANQGSNTVSVIDTESNAVHLR